MIGANDCIGSGRPQPQPQHASASNPLQLYFFILCIVSESLRVHLTPLCVVASRRPSQIARCGAREAVGVARRVCATASRRESGQNHVSLFLTHLFCPPWARGCTGCCSQVLVQIALHVRSLQRKIMALHAFEGQEEIAKALRTESNRLNKIAKPNEDDDE